MVTAVEQKVATTMGPIMSVGEWEPWAALRAIMVVGMTVKLDEVTAIKVHWALEAVSLLGFSSCRWAMAFRPKGVQAFPKPKKLALMLKEQRPWRDGQVERPGKGGGLMDLQGGEPLDKTCIPSNTHNPDQKVSMPISWPQLYSLFTSLKNAFRYQVNLPLAWLNRSAIIMPNQM